MNIRHLISIIMVLIAITTSSCGGSATSTSTLPPEALTAIKDGSRWVGVSTYGFKWDGTVTSAQQASNTSAQELWCVIVDPAYKVDTQFGGQSVESRALFLTRENLLWQVHPLVGLTSAMTPQEAEAEFLKAGCKNWQQ